EQKIVKEAQCVFGTPNTVNQVLKKYCVNMDKIKIVVIDGEDEMYEQGQWDSVQKIFGRLSKTTQFVVSSVSFSLPVMKICKQIPNALLICKYNFLPEDYVSIAVENEMYKIDAICELIRITNESHC